MVTKKDLTWTSSDQKSYTGVGSAAAGELYPAALKVLKAFASTSTTAPVSASLLTITVDSQTVAKKKMVSVEFDTKLAKRQTENLRANRPVGVRADTSKGD